MRTRTLPPEEWDKLEPTGMPPLFPFVRPEDISVVVVEDDDGKLLAAMTVLRVVHFEGAWVNPEKEGIGVTRALLRAACDIARGWNDRWVMGGAAVEDETMHRVCDRLGGVFLPMNLYGISLEGESCRLPS